MSWSCSTGVVAALVMAAGLAQAQIVVPASPVEEMQYVHPAGYPPAGGFS